MQTKHKVALGLFLGATLLYGAITELSGTPATAPVATPTTAPAAVEEAPTAPAQTPEPRSTPECLDVPPEVLSPFADGLDRLPGVTLTDGKAIVEEPNAWIAARLTGPRMNPAEDIVVFGTNGTPEDTGLVWPATVFTDELTIWMDDAQPGSPMYEYQRIFMNSGNAALAEGCLSAA
jgi:hypothetical protein